MSNFESGKLGAPDPEDQARARMMASRTASAPVPFETLLQKVKEARKGAPVYDSTWVTFESLIMEIERLREEVASLKSKT